MNRQLKENNATKDQQDSKIEITQLSGLTELNDQELELIVGGWFTGFPFNIVIPIIGSILGVKP